MVNRIKKHKAYQKYVKSHKKYMAHDPQNLCNIGDRVKIIETRPLSKRKRWQILEIIEEASLGEA
jgi:small subunit ribosomal protein S17